MNKVLFTAVGIGRSAPEILTHPNLYKLIEEVKNSFSNNLSSITVFDIDNKKIIETNNASELIVPLKYLTVYGIEKEITSYRDIKRAVKILKNRSAQTKIQSDSIYLIDTEIDRIKNMERTLYTKTLRAIKNLPIVFDYKVEIIDDKTIEISKTISKISKKDFEPLKHYFKKLEVRSRYIIEKLSNGNHIMLFAVYDSLDKNISPKRIIELTDSEAELLLTGFFPSTLIL